MLTCSEVFVKLNNGSGWRGWPGPCHRLPWAGLLSNSRWSHSFCARNKMKVKFQCHSLRLVLPLLLSVSIQRRNQTSETVKAGKRRLCNRWASSSTKLQPLLMSSASDLYLTLNCAGPCVMQVIFVQAQPHWTMNLFSSDAPMSAAASSSLEPHTGANAVFICAQ